MTTRGEYFCPLFINVDLHPVPTPIPFPVVRDTNTLRHVVTVQINGGEERTEDITADVDSEESWEAMLAASKLEDQNKLMSQAKEATNI